jgi:hypothetical protein
MVGQDFDSDPVAPAHHAFLGGGLMPWLVLGGLLLVGLVLMIVQQQGRQSRIQRIYVNILSAAQEAAAPRNENEAVRYMLKLRDAINTELGSFVLSGDLAHLLKAFDDALNKAPKPADVKPAPATVSGSFAMKDHRLVSNPDEETKPPTTTGKAYDAAKKFYEYWKQRQARCDELLELQSKLTRG